MPTPPASLSTPPSYTAAAMTYYCDGKRHLVCVPYSIEGLHQMAASLNIKRCWFHAGDKPHYDMPKTRIAEITAKCKPVSSREVLAIIQEKRQA